MATPDDPTADMDKFVKSFRLRESKFEEELKARDELIK